MQPTRIWTTSGDSRAYVWDETLNQFIEISPTNLVYTTGNQTISGIKTFAGSIFNDEFEYINKIPSLTDLNTSPVSMSKIYFPDLGPAPGLGLPFPPAPGLGLPFCFKSGLPFRGLGLF